MTKKKETITVNQSFTCPNPLCQKNFSNPIKAKNLGSKNLEVYDACPYCLTEITLEESPTIIEEKQKMEEKEPEIEESSMPFASEKPAKVHSKLPGCEHHFGYLSQRSSKEKIPDECITCEKIVQCMLKNVTG